MRYEDIVIHYMKERENDYALFADIVGAASRYQEHSRKLLVENLKLRKLIKEMWNDLEQIECFCKDSPYFTGEETTKAILNKIFSDGKYRFEDVVKKAIYYDDKENNI